MRQRTQLVLRKVGSGWPVQTSLPKISGLQCLGGNARGLSIAPPKTETITELKEMLQSIWKPASGTDREGCEEMLRKRLEARVAAEGGHFEHSQWLWYCGYEFVAFWCRLNDYFTGAVLKCKKSRGCCAAVFKIPNSSADTTTYVDDA